MKKYNWATLGCGVIANQLAEAMISRGDNLYSVENRASSEERRVGKTCRSR